MKDKKIDSTAYCAPVIIDFNDFASERNPAQECEIQLKIDTAIQNFNKVSNNQNVLFVHCAMGMSRSASCVIMYIMKKFKIGFEQVFEFVQSRREKIDPNEGFIDKLKELERNHFKFSSQKAGIMISRHDSENLAQQQLFKSQTISFGQRLQRGIPERITTEEMVTEEDEDDQ